MRIRPEGLRVGEEGVQACDEGRTPQVRGGPTVWQEFSRGRESERVGLEEGEEVREEESPVRRQLYAALSALHSDGRSEYGRIPVK